MSEHTGLKVRVRGIVQGVGFRPFVYGLAVRNQLTGWVRNTSSGVEIEVNGPQDGLQAFLEQLQQQPPPLARIDSFEAEISSTESLHPVRDSGLRSRIRMNLFRFRRI